MADGHRDPARRQVGQVTVIERDMDAEGATDGLTVLRWVCKCDCGGVQTTDTARLKWPVDPKTYFSIPATPTYPMCLCCRW